MGQGQHPGAGTPTGQGHQRGRDNIPGQGQHPRDTNRAGTTSQGHQRGRDTNRAGTTSQGRDTNGAGTTSQGHQRDRDTSGAGTTSQGHQQGRDTIPGTPTGQGHQQGRDNIPGTPTGQGHQRGRDISRAGTPTDQGHHSGDTNKSGTPFQQVRDTNRAGTPSQGIPAGLGHHSRSGTPSQGRDTIPGSPIRSGTPSQGIPAGLAGMDPNPSPFHPHRLFQVLSRLFLGHSQGFSGNSSPARNSHPSPLSQLPWDFSQILERSFSLCKSHFSLLASSLCWEKVRKGRIWGGNSSLPSFREPQAPPVPAPSMETEFSPCPQVQDPTCCKSNSCSLGFHLLCCLPMPWNAGIPAWTGWEGTFNPIPFQP
ncbi:uncharacterized protein LOC127059370 [Serinus canaria]|uniref:uncharacterized protein LOC127059370 n=1 Tax=Serinus canaria TaxID=9135 RepID=UPI0021CC55CC|nr:uncharacterized protein LOC127059370 [Serinus canaria]